MGGPTICCAVAAISAQDPKPRIHYWDLLMQNPSGVIGEQASMVSWLAVNCINQPAPSKSVVYTTF